MIFVAAWWQQDLGALAMRERCRLIQNGIAGVVDMVISLAHRSPRWRVQAGCGATLALAGTSAEPPRVRASGLAWSLGWTGCYEPSVPPTSWMHRLEMTSFTFMLDWVPDPVCHTYSGNSSSSAR